MPVETIIAVDETHLCTKLSSLEIANIFFAVCTHLTDKFATFDSDGHEASTSYLNWCFPYIKRIIKAEYELIRTLIDDSEHIERFDLITEMSVLRYLRSHDEDSMDTKKYTFPMDEDPYTHPLVLMEIFTFMRRVCIKSIAAKTNRYQVKFARLVECQTIQALFKVPLKNLTLLPLDDQLEVTYILIKLEL